MAENFSIDVKGIMDTWVYQMNYPVITVSQSASGRMKLRQDRFLNNPKQAVNDKSKSVGYVLLLLAILALFRCLTFLFKLLITILIKSTSIETIVSLVIDKLFVLIFSCILTVFVFRSQFHKVLTGIEVIHSRCC